MQGKEKVLEIFCVWTQLFSDALSTVLFSLKPGQREYDKGIWIVFIWAAYTLVNWKQCAGWIYSNKRFGDGSSVFANLKITPKRSP